MLQCQSYIGALAPFCLLATLTLFTLTASYKPVIVIHGLMESPLDFQLFLQFISETHPGTNVTVVDLYDHGASTTPLWLQVEDFRRAIHPIMQNAADGVHLICYSQGGLICRALLSTMPDHNVDTFISLSSPQMGQYGDANMTLFFPGYVKSNLYRFCYTFMGQSFSICNYWNDPYHHTLYLKNNEFLPMLNAEKPHPNATAWKKNFLRIRKLVLIGGPNDGIIGPWESSLFGFYDGYGVREMKSQWVYLQDTFGLKTLDARGDIASCVMPGIAHTQWHSNRKVYDTCIAKWLT